MRQQQQDNNKITQTRWQQQDNTNKITTTRWQQDEDWQDETDKAMMRWQ